MYDVDDKDQVRELQNVPQSSGGAPLPLVLGDDDRVVLAYYVRQNIPGWDGSWVRIMSPSEGDEPVAIVSFSFCYAYMFGPPNDEAFTGHPLACAVAVANWKLLAKPNPVPLQMEEFWKTSLEPARGLPKVRDVRVRGTIAAIELDVSGGYLADIGRHMRRTCLEDGVLLRPLGSVLYAMPPLCTSQGSLARIARAMFRAVSG